MPLNIPMTWELVPLRKTRTHSGHKQHFIGQCKRFQIRPVFPGAGKDSSITGEFTIETIETQSSQNIRMAFEPENKRTLIISLDNTSSKDSSPYVSYEKSIQYPSQSIRFHQRRRSTEQPAQAITQLVGIAHVEHWHGDTSRLTPDLVESRKTGVCGNLLKLLPHIFHALRSGHTEFEGNA